MPRVGQGFGTRQERMDGIAPVVDVTKAVKGAT